MTCGGVFSRRTRRSFSIGAERCGGGDLVFQKSDICEAELHKIGDSQRPGFGDMAEGVPSDVIIVGGIGELADSHAIQDNPYDSLEFRHCDDPFSPNGLP
jgi:hypothetical protein